MPSEVVKSDKATAGFMIIAYDIDDDDVTLDAAIGFIAALLSKKMRTKIDNIVLFPQESGFCINADPTETIETILKNRKENDNV